MNIEVKDNRELYNKLIEVEKEYESAKPKLEELLEGLSRFYTYGFILKLDKILTNYNKEDVIKIVGEVATGKTTLEKAIRRMCPDIKLVSTNALMKDNEYLKHKHILISRNDWRCFFS